MDSGPSPQRVFILGVPMDCVTMAQAVLIADDMVRCDRQGSILAINPEKIVAASSRPTLMHGIRMASLLIPDGIGAVLAARIGGVRNIGRVPGADLMPELCSLAESRGYPVFIFGGRPEVNQLAGDALRQRFPRLRIAGQSHGYLTSEEMEGLPERINASGARIMFVGLGSPTQERWIQENLPKLTTVMVCQGVGGTLDVLAGRVRRAPPLWRQMYLEWLYRLVREPKRVRRFPSLLRFAYRVWREGVVIGGSS